MNVYILYTVAWGNLGHWGDFGQQLLSVFEPRLLREIKKASDVYNHLFLKDLCLLF